MVNPGFEPILPSEFMRLTRALSESMTCRLTTESHQEGSGRSHCCGGIFLIWDLKDGRSLLEGGWEPRVFQAEIRAAVKSSRHAGPSSIEGLKQSVFLEYAETVKPQKAKINIRCHSNGY